MSIKQDFWTRTVIDNRGWFVVFFVVPLSLVYDLSFRLRAWVIYKFYSAPTLHRKRVEEISKNIKQYQEGCAQKEGALQEVQKKLCTARGGWESISPGFRDYKKKSQCIPINLYDILEFSTKTDVKTGEQPFVRAEPMVNMGQLSHYLIPKGHTIPVLPEMDDLTVGGLMMGVGIETSSHLYGLFNDCVLEAEVILASGEVVVCSKTENRELFDALPWSYGTLGFLASVKIMVIPCKRYVRLEYFPVFSRKEGLDLIEKFSTGTTVAQFVEALQYSEAKMVVMRGNYASSEDVRNDKDGYGVNSISLWFKPWFYKHVESFLSWKSKAASSTAEPLPTHVEYIPLRDYYHRHTKSIFWELDLILQPFNGNFWLFRWLLGWALPPKVSFLKLTQTESLREMYEREHVIQDMLIPLSEGNRALDVFHKEYDIYPLWVCPFRMYDYGEKEGAKTPHRCFLRKPANAKYLEKERNLNYELYLDLGAYGVPRAVLEKRHFDIVSASRKVESYVASVNGFQMLYADSYMSREEFRDMFEHNHYDLMKKKYDPFSSFPEVYDKVSTRWKNEGGEGKKVK